jgi:hypothetical protein
MVQVYCELSTKTECFAVGNQVLGLWGGVEWLRTPIFMHIPPYIPHFLVLFEKF